MADALFVSFVAVFSVIFLGFCHGELTLNTCQLHPLSKGEDGQITELTLTACDLQEIHEFPSLEVLRLHLFNGKLQMNSKLSNLTTLAIHSGHFEIDPTLSTMAPNLKSLTLEDVRIDKIQKGTLAGFLNLEELSIIDSTIGHIESNAIKLQMHENSLFSVANSTLEHLFDNAIDIEAAEAHLQSSSIQTANTRSVRLRTNALLFKGNQIERAEAHALEVHAPKISFEDNQWNFANSNVLSAVSLTASEASYFSLKNNTFQSQTSIDVDFRQLNNFDSIHLNTILVVENNVLPCTCKLPFAPDSSTRFAEHSRDIYYQKIHDTSICLHSKDTLRRFLQQECKTNVEEDEFAGVPVRVVPPDEEYYFVDDVPSTVEPQNDKNLSQNLNQNPNVSENTQNVVEPKIAENLDRNLEAKQDSSTSENASYIIGPVILVVVALLVLLTVLVAIFWCKVCKSKNKQTCNAI